jgi:hypothetical protein
MFLRRVPCPHCGYDVRANVTAQGARCPECGVFTSTAELNDPFARPEVRRYSRLTTYSLFVPALVALMAGGFLTILEHNRASDGTFFLVAQVAILVVAMVTLAAVVVTLIYSMVLWKHESLASRLMSAMLCVVIVLITNTGLVIAGAFVFVMLAGLRT